MSNKLLQQGLRDKVVHNQSLGSRRDLDALWGGLYFFNGIKLIIHNIKKEKRKEKKQKLTTKAKDND